MEKTSEILAAIKALQIHIGGQIHAMNRTLQGFVHSVDSRFADSKLQSKTSLHMNLGKSGFEAKNLMSGIEISPILRCMKVDVPNFDGTDPQGWIFRVEEFFDFHGTPDHMRLRFVSLQMEGRAAAWFEWMRVNTLLKTWPEFIASLKNRFGSSPYNDSQGLLSTQSSTIAKSRSASGDSMNKEGCELKYSELEIEAKEADDWAISDAAIKIVENDALLDNVETKVVESVVVENVEAPRVSASFALHGGSHVPYYLDEATGWSWEVIDVKKQLGTAKPVTMIKMQDKRSISQEDIVKNLCWKMGMLCYGWGDTLLEVSRRLFIFNLYALEEVYKELFSLHLEDKVVFEEGGNDTHTIVGSNNNEAQKERTRAQVATSERPKREVRFPAMLKDYEMG